MSLINNAALCKVSRTPGKHPAAPRFTGQSQGSTTELLRRIHMWKVQLTAAVGVVHLRNPGSEASRDLSSVSVRQFVKLHLDSP
ncbi:unnamed protein product [Pleuronectes platessa]|uniref:Uncharacterized protein n=1 Tax=Pleuronectes platessa TaxID=8262 RepID=A0A9N7YWZ9_PLEPL|nr:unnamed protein product [Pleuronectes platessa]